MCSDISHKGQFSTPEQTITNLSKLTVKQYIFCLFATVKQKSLNRFNILSYNHLGRTLQVCVMVNFICQLGQAMVPSCSVKH